MSFPVFIMYFDMSAFHANSHKAGLGTDYVMNASFGRLHDIFDV